MRLYMCGVKWGFTCVALSDTLYMWDAKWDLWDVKWDLHWDVKWDLHWDAKWDLHVRCKVGLYTERQTWRQSGNYVLLLKLPIHLICRCTSKVKLYTWLYQLGERKCPKLQLYLQHWRNFVKCCFHHHNNMRIHHTCFDLDDIASSPILLLLLLLLLLPPGHHPVDVLRQRPRVHLELHPELHRLADPVLPGVHRRPGQPGQGDAQHHRVLPLRRRRPEGVAENVPGGGGGGAKGVKNCFEQGCQTVLRKGK